VVLGTEALKKEEQSVPFAEAVAYTRQVKQHRAARTQSDIAYYMRRLMRAVPGLAEKSLRSLTPQDCREALQIAYPTPSQQRKARAILSGVFSVGRRRGWCSENPLQLVDAPVVQEKEIVPLPLHEVRQLVETARRKPHRAALPALGLMLHAGVRPQEVTRLQWGDIDFEEREICIPARHSKTGGARHIPVSPPLLQMLVRYRGCGRICPPNWRSRWLELRRSAGFEHWVPDVLRHTFASYHAKHFRDIAALQLSMGHRDQRLLMSRYINLRGITRRQAAAFWKLQL
jgi:integrase